jgi:glycosyltransferase involved in cell wall biosynthesis
VVPSRSLQAVAERDWRLDMRRVHYIPNGIASRTSRPRVRTELGLGLPPHLLRIIWVGALRPEKNPLRMIRAFAQLKARAALLIVGDGSQGEAVRQEVDRLGLQERVRLLGARTDTRDLIMQCDVLALTSDTEQMPLVVLEAMDAGLAIAASDVGDIRFMVSEENRPFIVSPTEADLAGALTKLLADEARRRTIGQANRVRLLSVYRLEQMIDAYRHLFDQVAPPRERRAAHG